jgi:hypothetical protein
MNFLTEKIQGLEAEKINNKKLIAEREQDITEKDKEIERLRVLEERLKKLQTVKYHENLVSPERVAGLTNQVTLKDFLESFDGLIPISYTFDTKTIKLGELSLWQAIFLLFGDIDTLGQKKPAEDLGPAPNVAFDANKKFI